MEVIKAVDAIEGKLVSTFARGKWQKEYAQGAETKPDVGYLFAYSKSNLKGAKKDMCRSSQFWLAEAEVVGRITRYDITIFRWSSFWADFKLRLRDRGAEYLLCSSITLIRKIK